MSFLRFKKGYLAWIEIVKQPPVKYNQFFLNIPPFNI